MAGRRGRGGHAVVSCWKVGGGDPGDTRGGGRVSSDPRIDEAGVSGRSAAAPPPGSCTHGGGIAVGGLSPQPRRRRLARAHRGGISGGEAAESGAIDRMEQVKGLRV